MLIVDDINNLIDVVVSERSLELSLDLHAVDCFQGLYWNRLFVGLSAGNVTKGQNIYRAHQQSTVFFFCGYKCRSYFSVAHMPPKHLSYFGKLDCLPGWLPRRRHLLILTLVLLRRANAQQPKLFVGMILILIFAEALALYGLIVGIILSSRAGQSRAD